MRVSDPLPPIIPALTNRGFTGHEHIDEMGLIHMNGRVYDPQIGRFLSADPYIAFASFTKGGVCHALNDVALSIGDGVY
jgi:RHS repeat-associated protein